MKNLNFKSISLLFLSLLFSYTSTVAQEDETEPEEKNYHFTVNADFVSRYVWRGQQLGGMAVQPLMEFSKGNFVVGSFGSYSLTDDTYLQEADIYVSYTVADMLNFTVSDYYFPVDFANKTTYYNYFEYRADSTGHIIEPAITFDGAALGVPISLLVVANLYGADFRKLNGDMNYSSYAELAYKGGFKGGNYSVFTGISITTPGDDLPSFYGNTKPAVVNIGIKIEKELKVTDTFSIPISASFITNPDAGNVWLVFSASLGN